MIVPGPSPLRRALKNIRAAIGQPEGFKTLTFLFFIGLFLEKLAHRWPLNVGLFSSFRMLSHWLCNVFDVIGRVLVHVVSLLPTLHPGSRKANAGGGMFSLTCAAVVNLCHVCFQVILETFGPIYFRVVQFWEKKNGSKTV